MAPTDGELISLSTAQPANRSARRLLYSDPARRIGLIQSAPSHDTATKKEQSNMDNKDNKNDKPSTTEKPAKRAPMIIELSQGQLAMVIGGLGTDALSFLKGRCPAHGPVQ
jgi:hypothetical protein